MFVKSSLKLLKIANPFFSFKNTALMGPAYTVLKEYQSYVSLTFQFPESA